MPLRGPTVLCFLCLLLAGTNMGQCASEGSSAAPESDIDFPIIRKVQEGQKELARRRWQERREKEFKDIRLLIQRASLKEAADEKIRAYLRARKGIDKMRHEHPEPKLEKLSEVVERKILQVPPPLNFNEVTGVEMVLARSGSDLFYVSRKPVSPAELSAFLGNLPEEEAAPARADVPQPAGDEPGTEAMTQDVGRKPFTAVSWTMAVRFCKWLTAQNRRRYRLPAKDELAAAEGPFPCALWTRSEWEGPDRDALEMRLRFGMPMHCIWDPAHLIGAADVFGELPFATYPELGFMVVTDVRTGVQDRLNRLRAEQ